MALQLLDVWKQGVVLRRYLVLSAVIDTAAIALLCLYLIVQGIKQPRQYTPKDLKARQVSEIACVLEWD